MKTKWGRSLRIVAATLAVALVAGTAMIIQPADTKPAEAATTTCPSTNLQYYRDRHWAPCLWGTEHYWAAGLYQCTRGHGFLQSPGGKYIATFVNPYVDPNAIRACQDVNYNLTEMPNSLKNYYLTDLYKLAVAAKEYDGKINALIGSYYNWFVYFGSGWPAVSAALMIPTCAALVEPLLPTGPYTMYYAGVACAWGWRYAFDEGH